MRGPSPRRRGYGPAGGASPRMTVWIASSQVLPELAALSLGCYLKTMQPSAVQTISPDQFFAWVAGREQRFELVEGEVVMMAGAGRRHDSIVVNLTAAVHSQVRGGPCQTFTSDTYISTSPCTRRMAD